MRAARTSGSADPDADLRPRAAQAAATAAAKHPGLSPAAREAFERAYIEEYIRGSKEVIDRVAAIMALPQSQGRERAALHLAINAPDMTPADIASYLDEHVRRASARYPALVSNSGNGGPGADARERGRQAVLRAKGKPVEGEGP